MSIKYIIKHLIYKGKITTFYHTADKDICNPFYFNTEVINREVVRIALIK